ncbi:MAG: hypothetical protein J6Q31_04925 [Alistipes sp.]|nr:hypothetical protein [Alistipes sp.]
MNNKIICRADKANKQGEAPLYRQFYHEGHRKKVTSSVVIKPRFWDDMAQQAKAQQIQSLLGFVFSEY